MHGEAGAELASTRETWVATASQSSAVRLPRNRPPSAEPSRALAHPDTPQSYTSFQPFTFTSSNSHNLALNDHATNTAQAFCTNYVLTSKNNAATFVPKCLLGASRALQSPRLTSRRAIQQIRQHVLFVHRSVVYSANERTHAAQPSSSKYLARRLRRSTQRSHPSPSYCSPLPSRLLRRPA